jgi:uncharacterized iron-regulated membrane protein
MKRTVHRSIFWLHLIGGLVSGLVILSMALSGLILAFEVQLTDWANRCLNTAPPMGASLPASTAALLEHFYEAHSDVRIETITWKSNPRSPVTLGAGKGVQFYADQWNAKMLGSGNQQVRHFFRSVTEWHRFLAGTGLHKEAGKFITGAACLVFGGLLVSGIYLWWPKRWSQFRAGLIINQKLTGRARQWNWHNVFGFWSAIPILVTVCTGLLISYSWANNLLFWLSGNEPPPRSHSATKSERNISAAATERELLREWSADLRTLDRLLQQARSDNPGWKSMTLRLPLKPGSPYPVTCDMGGRGQVQFRRSLLFDPQQQTIAISPDDISKVNGGRRWRMYARFLHTGELFGLPGQIMAAGTATAASVLCITGLSLAWRRFRARRT